VSSRRIDAIYVVTDGPAPERHEAVAAAAVAGGASWVQLREKNLTDLQLLAVARALRRLTQDTETALIVNDRLDIALASGAEGVHLGQEDLPVGAARRLLGPGAVIGVSTGCVEEAAKAEADGASYVAVGPVFPTVTKADAGPAVGLELIRQVKQAVSIPVVAIGGISVANIGFVAAAGADAAAVVSAVAEAPDMAGAVRALARAFAAGRTPEASQISRSGKRSQR